MHRRVRGVVDQTPRTARTPRWCLRLLQIYAIIGLPLSSDGLINNVDLRRADGDLLVIARPPSRHTYGFVISDDRGSRYDLPLAEIRQYLLSGVPASHQHDICFIEAGVGLGREPLSGGASKGPRQSRNQAKKKRLKPLPLPCLYWLEGLEGDVPPELVDEAVSRSILIHASFKITQVVSIPSSAWRETDRDNNSKPSEVDGSQVDIVDMSSPNLSSAEKLRLRTKILTITTGLKIEDLSNIQDPVVIIDACQDTVRLFFGRRAAIGLAGNEGAPSQALRRTNRGVLKRFALKERPAIVASKNERSNISTAMEPEIAFLMASLALAGLSANGGSTAILDPCCGSGSLLLSAAALGANHLIGVDLDSSVWDEHEFRRHETVFDARPLAIPEFVCGDVSNPTRKCVLSEPNSIGCIVCDPPYNVGAPVILDGKDRRPANHHRSGQQIVESQIDSQVDERADLVPYILDIAKRVLVTGGRLVMFMPVRGRYEATLSLEELVDLKLGDGAFDSDLILRNDCSRLQRFSPTFSRWLVCMEKRT